MKITQLRGDLAAFRKLHAHACLRAGRYYEAQLQLPVEWKEEEFPVPVQRCRVSYDPTCFTIRMHCRSAWNNLCGCPHR